MSLSFFCSALLAVLIVSLSPRNMTESMLCPHDYLLIFDFAYVMLRMGPRASCMVAMLYH